MAKLFIGFSLGVAVGVVVLVGGWFALSRSVPFPQRALDSESRSYMKRFVHDVTTFHNGTHDMDGYRTAFSFGTSVDSSENYFSRVDAAIRDSGWKLLDSYGGFRLYVNEWEPAGPSAYRLEIALRFDSKTQKVSFEETRREE